MRQLGGDPRNNLVHLQAFADRVNRPGVEPAKAIPPVQAGHPGCFNAAAARNGLWIDTNQPTVVPPPTLMADAIPNVPPA